MMQNIRYKLLVVLYKMTLSESSTIRSIVDYFSVKENHFGEACELIIWDNSPTSSEEDISAFQQQISSLPVKYFHTPENRTLSKIYNEVASQLAEDEYLTLLDQDSLLPTSYFEELKMAQRDHWPLILPKVECQGLLVSPAKRFFARGRRLKEISSGEINSKNLLAINSGMSILGKVFHSINYDERLRFYGTDTFFMRNYEKYFDQVYVLATPVAHSLAEMESKTDDWRAARKKEDLRVLHIIFNNSIIEILSAHIYAAALRSKAWVSNLLRVSA